MDVIGLPGIEEANAELDRLIAEDAKGTTGTQGTEGDQASAEKGEAQRAAPVTDGAQTSDPQKLEADRLKAEAETKSKAEAETKSKAEAEAKAKGDAGKGAGAPGEKSRFAKAQERLGKTWEEVNAEKAALKAERDALKAERDRIEADRAEFDGKRQEAEAEFSPDQYEAAARKFDNEGKFDLAELAREKAATLRQNPPQSRGAADGFSGTDQGQEPAAGARGAVVPGGAGFEDSSEGHLRGRADREPRSTSGQGPGARTDGGSQG